MTAKVIIIVGEPSVVPLEIRQWLKEQDNFVIISELTELNKAEQAIRDSTGLSLKLELSAVVMPKETQLINSTKLIA